MALVFMGMIKDILGLRPRAYSQRISLTNRTLTHMILLNSGVILFNVRKLLLKGCSVVFCKTKILKNLLILTMM